MLKGCAGISAAQWAIPVRLELGHGLWALHSKLTLTLSVAALLWRFGKLHRTDHMAVHSGKSRGSLLTAGKTVVLERFPGPLMSKK